MTGLVILTVVAVAGCKFLIYFMFALWRDSRKPRHGQRVEIRRFPRLRKDKGQLLHLYSGEDILARAQRRV